MSQLPLSKLCVVPFPLQREGRQGAEKRGGRGVASKAKKNKGRVKTGQATKQNNGVDMFRCE